MLKKFSFLIVLLFMVVMFVAGACRGANNRLGLDRRDDLTLSPSTPIENGGSGGTGITATPAIKPADAEMPAAGICAQAEGLIAEIRLNDPPPPDPRCLQAAPEQYLKVINGTASKVRVRLAHYDLLIPPGGETAFDLPLGAFLAPGVHQLSPAGEIWVREDLAADATMNTPPTHLQFTNFNLGYSVTYPSDWTVEDYGLTQPNKEVILYPADAAPFVAYFSISIDARPLAEIEALYALELPEVEKIDTTFAGQPAVLYTYPGGRSEYYVTRGQRIFLILTDRPEHDQVQGILESLEFQD